MPDSTTRPESRPDVPMALQRGLRCRCPACGEGRLFGRFLKVAPACPACGEELHHHRADDLPAYVVIVIVCHIIGAGILFTEMRYSIPILYQAIVWPLLTVVLSLVMLQPTKGAVVGLQYALGMHGFGRPRTAFAGSRAMSES